MFTRFVIYSIIALVTLFLTIVLGDYAPWYFAWVIGTTLLVLIAAASGAMFDNQFGEAKGHHSEQSH